MAGVLDDRHAAVQAGHHRGRHLHLIGTWNDFLGPLLYLQDEEKYTLSLGLASFQSVFITQWGYLMAASAAVIVPIVALFFFLQRYFIEGVTLTGIKN